MIAVVEAGRGAALAAGATMTMAGAGMATHAVIPKLRAKAGMIVTRLVRRHDTRTMMTEADAAVRGPVAAVDAMTTTMTAADGAARAVAMTVGDGSVTAGATRKRLAAAGTIPITAIADGSAIHGATRRPLVGAGTIPTMVEAAGSATAKATRKRLARVGTIGAAVRARRAGGMTTTIVAAAVPRAPLADDTRMTMIAAAAAARAPLPHAAVATTMTTAIAVAGSATVVATRRQRARAGKAATKG